jgi:hypothetical protein
VTPRLAQTLPAALILVGLVACGSLEPVDPGGEGAGAPPNAGPVGPPPVTVSGGGRSIELEAWTYCFGNGCADGFPPANPPDLGAAPRIEIDFPLDGWTFEAEFTPVGQACPRRQMVPAEQTGAQTHALEPAGLADRYDVMLFGRGQGEGGGDLFVTFRWTTPIDGPMPVPRARLAILADHDGVVDSYGVELELAELAATPVEATAEVTVTAANGRAVTFELVRAPGCIAEGTIYWDGPDQPGLEAATLGPAPFTYDAVVTLDGVQHTATATWPDDEIAGNEPSVSLDFTPPLPALP